MSAVAGSLTDSTGTRIQISVVVPVFMGREWIGACLRSLQAQSLSPSLFEIILVFNGPDDGTEEAVSDFIRRSPGLKIRKVHCAKTSASAARNLGSEVAQGEWVTWVDCDDLISREYLELMILSARDGVVPLAQIIDQYPDGTRNPSSVINRSILEHEGHLVSPADFPRGLSFMTCKLVPTAVARDVPFDESLRSGEDVAMFAEMFSRYDFKFSLLPAFGGAKYFRLLRESSVSRQGDSFDFMVTQRLDVIASLNRSLRKCRPYARPLVRSFINSQASFVKNYCARHPEHVKEIGDTIAAHRFEYYPWNSLFESVQRLVIAYNFLPYADTGAMVTAKRIRSVGKPVDVIMHSMDNVRSSDTENMAISRPYVQFVGTVSGPAYFASPVAIEDFCRKGIEIVRAWEATGRSYTEVYSRAMWPASHFLAALCKLRDPKVRWIAEFSDPIRLTTTGEYRYSELPASGIFLEILEGVPSEIAAVLRENLDVYFWTEQLAYLLADQVVFTNENQMSSMLEYAGEGSRKLLSGKSKIDRQPTLSRLFYELESSDVCLDSQRVNIGYFGEFYSTRGIGEIVQGLRGLSVGELSRLQLHIFTSDPKGAQERFVASNAGSRIEVTFYSQLPYLKFLNTLTHFDCLIVNDSMTSGTHSINPYLPSKYSDYVGSSAKIWALVEKGSVLSGLVHEYLSYVGDVAGAREVLKQLVSDATMRIQGH